MNTTISVLTISSPAANCHSLSHFLVCTSIIPIILPISIHPTIFARPPSLQRSPLLLQLLNSFSEVFEIDAIMRRSIREVALLTLPVQRIM